MSNRSRVNVGDIFRIKLEDSEYGYSIKLEKGMAFFDYKSGDEISDEEIIKKPILFILTVDKNAVKNGGWQKVGQNKMFAHSIKVPNHFIWDQISEMFKLYITETGEIRLSTYEEIKDLECAASWSHNHVEDRLRDYYANRECVWINQLEKPKKKFV